MEERLLRIFQQSFGVSRIDETMSVDNVEGWDSMAHVGLIAVLQREFGVSIPPAMVIELTSIAGIKKFLREQGIQ